MTSNDDLLWIIKPGSAAARGNFNYSAGAALIAHTGTFYRLMETGSDSRERMRRVGSVWDAGRKGGGGRACNVNAAVALHRKWCQRERRGW